jgi:hypothetical protein
MHPKILERRKAVFNGRLEYASPEEWGKTVAAWVSHYEGKLPRPENYRKKTTERLRITLRKIDRLITLFERRPKHEELSLSLAIMYRRHREYIVKELHRRMMVKKA